MLGLTTRMHDETLNATLGRQLLGVMEGFRV